MSNNLLENDSARLPENDGRKNKLKGDDIIAPLRDQIVKKLFNDLKDDNIGATVTRMWNLGIARRANWLAKQTEYLQGWDEFLAPIADGPQDSTSNLHLPTIFIACRTYHARMNQALLGVDPPFTVKARRSDSQERQSLVQDFMAYTLDDWANFYEGIESVADQWLWDWITQGSALLKMRWEKRFSKLRDVVLTPKPGTPEIIQAEDGSHVAVPTITVVEEEKDIVSTDFNGPMYENVDLTDLVIIGGNGNPDKADHVIERIYMTASEMWQLVDQKIFDEEAVNKVIEGGKSNKSSALGNELRMQAKMNAGVDPGDDLTELDRYEILEAYLRKDVDGSGISSDIVVWVDVKTRELLRATYLRRINREGKRPYAKIDFLRRKGQEYGMGLPEIMYPFSTEMDAIHNMRIDFGLLSAMPFGFIRQNGNMEAENIQLMPGQLIPVQDPQNDIYFPNLGNRTSFGFQEEGALQQLIERLTSVNDLTLGANSTQGATRTATGARALVNETATNLDIFVKRMNRGFKKLLEYTLSMLQQRCPPGIEFRVIGDDGDSYFRTIREPLEIMGKFDFDLSPNSASSNKSIQQEMASQIMQLTANPMDLQLGIVTPQNRFEAIKNYLQQLGIKDYSRFINTKYEQKSNTLLTPKEMAGRILAGIPVVLDPTQDVQGFIDYCQYLFKTPDLLGQFNPQEAMALKSKMDEATKLMKALQQQAAQQANLNQQSTNAQNAQNQAPVGMSPVAGQMNAQGQGAGSQQL